MARKAPGEAGIVPAPPLAPKAAPKPVPRERGRGKGAKEYGSQSDRWKRKEREISRFFQTHDGLTENPTLRKLQTSTGRVGHLTDLGFDSVSRSFLIEVKCRTLPLWQHTAWVQAVQLAADYGLAPALALTHAEAQRTYTHHGKVQALPDLVCITPERLAQLLAYERQALAEEDE